MDIIKIKNNILAQIKHDLRELPEGKCYGNDNVDPSLSDQNYGLINRGNAEQVNEYRKNIEKNIFKYNRKGLVRALSACIQVPADCPIDKHDEFFRLAYQFFLSTLPAGEQCVLLAQVHKDERKYTQDGSLISKDHLHILYLPMVPDTKHDNFDWKLSAHDLTGNRFFRNLHPQFQKYLTDNFKDEKGHKIPCTVYKKKDGDGRAIKLTTKELKELTNKTGIVLKNSLSINELADILSKNHDIEIKNKSLLNKVHELESQCRSLENTIVSQNNTINTNNTDISTLAEKAQQSADINKSLEADNKHLREKVATMDAQQKYLQETIDEQNTTISTLTEKAQQSADINKSLEADNKHLGEKVATMDAQQQYLQNTIDEQNKTIDKNQSERTALVDKANLIIAKKNAIIKDLTSNKAELSSKVDVLTGRLSSGHWNSLMN